MDWRYVDLLEKEKRKKEERKKKMDRGMARILGSVFIERKKFKRRFLDKRSSQKKGGNAKKERVLYLFLIIICGVRFLV